MDLCEGRRIYADVYGFMRRMTDLWGFTWIYARDDGFMRIYIDLCEVRRIYADLCEGRRIHTDLYGFMRGTTDLCGSIWIYARDD